MYNCHTWNSGKNRVYWRCHNYSKKPPQARCRARCVIANGKINTMTGSHNHPPHAEKIKKLAKRPYITTSSANVREPEEQLVESIGDDNILCLINNEFIVS